MDECEERKPRFLRPSPELLFFLLVFGWPGAAVMLNALQTKNLVLCWFGWILLAWPWDAHGLPLLRAHWPGLDAALRMLRQWLAQPLDTRPGLSWLHHLTPGRCYIATGLACTGVSLLDAARPSQQAVYLAMLWLALDQVHAIKVRRQWMIGLERVDERAGRNRSDGVVLLRTALLSLLYFAIVAVVGGEGLRTTLDTWR